MKQKLFTLFFALVASAGTIFASVVIDGIAYNLNDETFTAEVTYSDAYTGEVVIPSSTTYNQQVYSVTSIGFQAFIGCGGLTSVTIPNSVTSIEVMAFANCAAFTTVTIPNSVTSIGSGAFGGCSGLTSINVASDNSNYCSVDGVLFNKGKTTLIQYPGGKQGAYTIPNSVTSIGNNAFESCSGLTSVTIPNSVTSIENFAFNNCSGLTSINVASDNSNYCSVDGVLFNKDKTTLIQYPEGKQGAYTIPNSVTSIEVYAFWDCSGLTSVTIGNSVTRIENFAFNNCTGLTSINVASDNSNYCSVDGVLFNKDKTTLIQYPGGKQGAYTIPNSVTSIEVYAFWDCSGLTSVTIPNSVTNIGNFAFGGCSAISSITSYAEIPPTAPYAFYDPNPSWIDPDKSTCKIYVPVGSVDLYKAAEGWRDFANILPIAAEETETTETKVTPDANSVDIAWPQVDNAYTYELVIKDKDGNIVCTLTFNAQGQLTSIAFNAPARGDAPQKTQTAGFSFTVTGLEEGTEYNLTISAKNENGQELDKKNVTFHTDGAQGLEDLHADSDKPVKVLHDGQIYILRGEKVYDAEGKMVK